jgi:outer membrane lipoprotein carrier protein
MMTYPSTHSQRGKITRFALSLRLAALSAWAILLCGSSSAQAPDVKSVAHAVDEHYNQLQSSKAAFTEIYQAPGINRTESGTVWLKKSGKMRWEYREPREKLFLTDSQNAYFYVPGEQQARKTSLKRIDDLRSPLRYLLGKTKLEKELDGLSFAPDIAPIQAGKVVLRGVPKAMADRVSEVLLEINQAHQITRILIRGTDGATTDFRFTGTEENIPVPDKFFRFSPPPGVATIPDEQTSQ